MDPDKLISKDEINSELEKPQDNSSVLISLEGMIKTYISQIDKNQDEAKKIKEMLDDTLTNDPVYAKHLEQANEAVKIKNKTKAEVLKKPQAHDLSSKLKELKGIIRANKDTLSDYLREFQRMSGVNEIEGEDGEVREIILVPKLVKKSSIFK